MRVPERQAVPVIVGFDHEIPAPVSVVVASPTSGDEVDCAIAASLAAAVTASLTARRPVPGGDGLKVRLRARLGELGLERSGLPERLDANLIAWHDAVAPLLGTHGLRAVVAAWLRCLPPEADGDPPAVAWSVDEPRVFTRLATLLFEILELPGERWIVTSAATWEAVRSLPRTADRCVAQGELAPGRPPEATSADAAGVRDVTELEHSAREAVRKEASLLDAESGGRLTAPPGLEAASARARSVAEAFLFAVLERRPATRGLFTVNATTPFAFGGRACEIDLSAPDLHLAIEVDGYFHFVEPAAWRRDRRKDLLLQMHGYTVLRCLAEDVVERLPAILEMIDRAVSFTRSRCADEPRTP